MLLNLESHTGLPICIEIESCEFLLGDGLNVPSLCTRKLHDLDPVWASRIDGEDKVIYRYTGPMWLSNDAEVWKQARVGYGVVYFPPGVYGGEFVKSSGQFHAILPGDSMATPEIYTVLVGRGHFMLQRSTPPYGDVSDAVLVEANAGETFAVPPDFGHLQINPTDGPLVFSYTVMNPLASNYEPYRRFHGATYYEMAEGAERFVFNPRYPRQVPLRILQAAALRQLPFLGEKPDYAEIRRCLPKLGFLTRPQDFPAEAYL
jgi:glucose-6-phosphate isomerase